ncbi:MAG: ROK family protein [Erysipelotrichaceae bacterium]|nr:ROK family protein [Erysipelotrichaceae bacterium]MDY5252168.1 ROK family protein [Erysipelotrichaceae bacterium]
MKDILAIDIGGTYIKYGMFDEAWQPLFKARIETPLNRVDFMQVLDDIILNLPSIKGIALAMPGFIDAQKGYAYTGGSLHYLDDTSIVALLQDRYQLPVSVENDARCATLAELCLGNLQDVDNGAAIILGTGIGGGIVIDRKIIKGNHLSAGEFSFLSIDMEKGLQPDNFWASNCGKRGIMKAIQIESGLDDIQGEQAFFLIKQGNQQVAKAMQKVAHKLAMWIIQLQYIIDPDKVVIGGGISQEPLFMAYIQEALATAKASYPYLPCFPKIERCKFANDANLIGALLHYQNQG